jgi:hypothetical protein
MDKLILKKIAKKWCKGILMACDLTDEETSQLLTEEEMDYIQKEAFKIANRITKEEQAHNLNTCIKEYYIVE